MEAGMELDAKVAEALGWTHPGSINWPAWGYPPGVLNEHPNGCAVPNYSISNADAIAALEETGQGWGLCRSASGDGMYRCNVGANGVWSNFPTLPLACCAAILAWAEAKKGGK